MHRPSYTLAKPEKDISRTGKAILVFIIIFILAFLVSYAAYYLQ